MKRLPDLWRRWMLFAGCTLMVGSRLVMADSQTTTAPQSNPSQTVSASAALDFQINIGKFIYFRVGTGVFPAANATVDTVTFNTVPSIPSGAVEGNAQTTSWTGSVPVFTSTIDASLPVEVRSNAGQISLRASVASPLSNGSATIPFSDIKIVSTDSNLPAPPIPDSGTGSAVNVAGTSFANLVTERTASWKFSYVGSGASTAGSYTGIITFTASAP